MMFSEKTLHKNVKLEHIKIRDSRTLERESEYKKNQ